MLRSLLMRAIGQLVFGVFSQQKSSSLVSIKRNHAIAISAEFVLGLLDDYDILRFLDIFTPNSDRKVAIEQFFNASNIQKLNLNIKDIASIFKELQKLYRQELNKTKLDSSGKPNKYEPKVWFTKIHDLMSYIKDQTKQSNMMSGSNVNISLKALPRNDTETDGIQTISGQESTSQKQVVAKNTTHKIAHNETAHNETHCSYTQQCLKTPSSSNKPAEKRKKPPQKSKSKTVLSKKKKNTDIIEDFISEVLCKFKDIATQKIQSAEEKKDTFDHFGTYVVSALRMIDDIQHSEAVDLQQQIVTLITNKNTSCKETSQKHQINL
ncbi:uncharacterized protein [Anoplolepis gracilipes]|uniref:uncharacterized protein n=1 Tax=Anoplolepis gracilipes TaxID=354296 RepID=UPI003BA09D15